jgi:hypothetical protein
MVKKPMYFFVSCILYMYLRPEIPGDGGLTEFKSMAFCIYVSLSGHTAGGGTDDYSYGMCCRTLAGQGLDAGGVLVLTVVVCGVV